MKLDLSNPAVQLLTASFLLILILWSIWMGSEGERFIAGIGPVLTMIFCVIMILNSISTMAIHELWPEAKQPKPPEHAGPPLFP